MDLAFTPRKPVTEASMITEGLQLWLDAADAGTLETDVQGNVRRWRDKSGKGHHALPADPSKLLRLQADPLNGKPVIRGTGAAGMRVGAIRAGLGPFTLFVVSQAGEAGGPEWQRIIGSWCGKGKDWLPPNWTIVRPGGAKPAAYAAKVFTISKRDGHALAGITLGDSPSGAHQSFTGDIAEILLFDRCLRFDEADAIEQYLTQKWGLK